MTLRFFAGIFAVERKEMSGNIALPYLLLGKTLMTCSLRRYFPLDPMEVQAVSWIIVWFEQRAMNSIIRFPSLPVVPYDDPCELWHPEGVPNTWKNNMTGGCWKIRDWHVFEMFTVSVTTDGIHFYCKGLVGMSPRSFSFGILLVGKNNLTGMIQTSILPEINSSPTNRPSQNGIWG